MPRTNSENPYRKHTKASNAYSRTDPKTKRYQSTNHGTTRYQSRKEKRRHLDQYTPSLRRSQMRYENTSKRIWRKDTSDLRLCQLDTQYSSSRRREQTNSAFASTTELSTTSQSKTDTHSHLYRNLSTASKECRSSQSSISRKPITRYESRKGRNGR